MNLKDSDFRPKVLMVGPGRIVQGGISAVVNSYYEYGLDRLVNLKYIASMEDGSYFKKLLTAIKAYIKFGLYIKKYEVVHVHMAAHASFYRKSFFIRRAYKANKKIIIHMHVGDFDQFFYNESNEKQKAYIKQIFSLADKVVVLSEKVVDFFAKEITTPDKISILHNGVRMPDYVKNEYGDHNILFLGRLEKPKGIYDLLKAIPLILKQVPDAMFYIGGDGEIEACKAIADKNGLSDHVKFLGWVCGSEKEEYFKSCSVFALPSYREGMPMSILEAMSYGLAVVTTNSGGIPEIIDDGINGIQIKAGEVSSLQTNIIELLNKPDYKERIAQGGYRKVFECFNMEHNINTLDEIYYKLTSASYKIITFNTNLEEV